MVIALPELLHVYADALHVQVEKSTLKLLASSQHVEEALITDKELKLFSYKVNAPIMPMKTVVRGYRTKKLCYVQFRFCTLVGKLIQLS